MLANCAITNDENSSIKIRIESWKKHICRNLNEEIMSSQIAQTIQYVQNIQSISWLTLF